jgi:hypothetical protein
VDHRHASQSTIYCKYSYTNNNTEYVKIALKEIKVHAPLPLPEMLQKKS